MSAITGMFGLNGGVSGTGVQGPQSASITNPTNQTQLNQAYNGAQGSMQQQQQLLAALQAQNGLGNQNQVYNQLQGVVNGTGPNPAQAQLAQATGANTANQAALMAGQRGSGANAGLMARQVAQQGAANQQNSIGQAATMQANQSLNALGQAANQANTMASNQIGQVNANTSAQQAEQQNLLNAQAGVNNANVSNQASINAANAGQAGQMTGLLGSALGGVSAGGAAALMASGGLIPRMADGGKVDQSAYSGPQSKFGQFIQSAPNVAPISSTQSAPAMGGNSQLESGMKNLTSALVNKDITPAVPTGGGAMTSMKAMANGGAVPVLLSPGEKKLTPAQAKAAALGKGNPMAMGKTVPGKPVVGGAKNDYANDIVKDSAEPGSVIIPRSITQGKDAERKSMDFVRAIYAKKGQLPKKAK